MKLIHWMALVASLLLAACATPPGASISGTGVVHSIAEGNEANQSTQVVGAIGGAVLGGWLCSNIGVRVYQRPTFRPGDRVAVSNGVITPLR